MRSVNGKSSAAGAPCRRPRAPRGAVVLAHAALESTIFTLAAAVENLAATAFIVVAGNLLVILLEGIVV